MYTHTLKKKKKHHYNKHNRRNFKLKKSDSKNLERFDGRTNHPVKV